MPKYQISVNAVTYTPVEKEIEAESEDAALSKFYEAEIPDGCDEWDETSESVEELDDEDESE